jgi:hypothetical protein
MEARRAPDRTGFGEMRAFSGLVGVDLPTFDDIKPGARLRGLDPAGLAEVVQVARFGADALNLVFRVDGRVGERLVYRGEESSFEFVEPGRAYAFDADGGLLRLASEAYRIRLAHLFDPYLAVSASQIEALPLAGGDALSQHGSPEGAQEGGPAGLGRLIAAGRGWRCATLRLRAAHAHHHPSCQFAELDVHNSRLPARGSAGCNRKAPV